VAGGTGLAGRVASISRAKRFKTTDYDFCCVWFAGGRQVQSILLPSPQQLLLPLALFLQPHHLCHGTVRLRRKHNNAECVRPAPEPARVDWLRPGRFVRPCLHGRKPAPRSVPDFEKFSDKTAAKRKSKESYRHCAKTTLSGPGERRPFFT